MYILVEICPNASDPVAGLSEFRYIAEFRYFQLKFATLVNRPEPKRFFSGVWGAMGGVVFKIFIYFHGFIASFKRELCLKIDQTMV